DPSCARYSGNREVAEADTRRLRSTVCDSWRATSLRGHASRGFRDAFHGGELVIGVRRTHAEYQRGEILRPPPRHSIIAIEVRIPIAQVDGRNDDVAVVVGVALVQRPVEVQPSVRTHDSCDRFAEATEGCRILPQILAT